MIGLWRLNPTTGYWALARMCAADTADAWLAVFQRDEPSVQFVLSVTKPRS